MTPNYEEEEKKDPRGASMGGRVLLCPDEWEDPAGRKVLDEYHKEGLLAPPECNDPDGGPAGGRWDMTTFTKMASEYHKKGAPFMESRSTRDGYRSLPDGTPAEMAESAALDRGHRTGVGDVGASAGHGSEDGSRPRRWATEESQEPDGRSLKARFLNVTTIEVLALGLVRALFGKRIRIPIRVKDSIDMDVILEDRDIILNTNSLKFVVPELKFWHITYAYKGKPVVEVGRGVKGRVNIHFWNMAVFIFALLRGSRKARKEIERAAREASRRQVPLSSGARAGEARDGRDDR